MGNQRILTLREKQSIFHTALAKLIVWAEQQNIHVFINELYRDQKRQKELVEQGKSKTMASLHIIGLAADLYIIKNGFPVLEHCKEYDILGQKWEEMGGQWGGHWKSIHDIYHFEIGHGMLGENTNEIFH